MRPFGRRPASWLAVVSVGVVVACAAPPPPVSPPLAHVAPSTTPSSSAAPASSSPPVQARLLEFAAVPLVDEPATFDLSTYAAWATGTSRAVGVPASPSRCSAFVGRAAKAVGACDEPADARARLDAAIDLRLDADARDAGLASLERCRGLEPGFVRALRVELAPAECRDELARPALEKPPASRHAAFSHVLVGHVVAAHAARASVAGSRPGATASDKANSIVAMTELDARASTLPAFSYGAAIARAAVAAGWATLAPLDHARALTVATAARRSMVDVGVGDVPLSDVVLGWAALPHGWLAELDALRIAQVAAPTRGPSRPRPIVNGVPACPHCWDDRRRAATEVARFAEELPSFYASWLLEPAEAASIDALRGFARRATLPVRVRFALASVSLGVDARALVAHARLSMGLHLGDRREIEGARASLETSPPAERSPQMKLVVALARSLRSWPGTDGSFAAPPGEDGLDVSALDELDAESDEDVRQLGIYDAGVLRELDVGARAGSLAPLRAQLARYRAAIDSGPGRTFVRDRHETLKRLFAAIDADASPPYAPSAAVHLVGWPAVHNGAGTWRESSGLFFAANRVGMVNTMLRRTSHRFLRCFEHPLGAAVSLRFQIERDGSVKTAVARPASPDDDASARCIAEVTRGLAFYDINFGIWTVEATFR